MYHCVWDLLGDRVITDLAFRCAVRSLGYFLALLFVVDRLFEFNIWF